MAIEAQVIPPCLIENEEKPKQTIILTDRSPNILSHSVCLGFGSTPAYNNQNAQIQLKPTPLLPTTTTMSSIMIPDLLVRAAELNEDGVYELSDGNFDQAVQSFEDAVKTMMQVCQITHGPSSSSSSSSSSHQSHGNLSKQLDTPVQQQELPPPARSCVEIPFVQEEGFYLYSCTVTFSPPPSSSSTTEPLVQYHPTSSEIAFYCATIFFNLALAHHQQGQNQQQNNAQQREASLRQALFMYQETAHTLQCMTGAMPPGTCLRDDILLMALATLNNQSQIMYKLFQHQQQANSNSTTNPPQTSSVTSSDDYESLKASFQRLMVESMSALQTNNNSFSIFEQSQINEFIRNAMVASSSLNSSSNGVNGIHAAACA